MRYFLRFLPIFIILFLNINTFAVEQVDVRSIKVERQLGNNKVEIKVRNSSGEIITYRDDISTGEIPVERCKPCRAPKLYETNPFGSNFYLDIGPSTNIRFTVMSSFSNSLYLSPREMVRKSAFYKRGGVVLEGKLEIFTTSTPAGIIAYDDDVRLEGNYSVNFGKPYFPTPNFRSTDWLNSVYNLDELRD